MEATTTKKRSIYVLEGTYRNRKIENTSFDLVKCYQPYPHKEGGFVTVKIKDLEQYQAPKSTIRISVDSESKLRDRAPEEKPQETDDEVIERMRKRFDILMDMTKATKRGDVRAMIVSGPPGVGKSFGVETVLEKYNTLTTIGNMPPKFEVVKGAKSPIG